MRCVSPESVPHPYGNSKAVRMTVPCGKCVNCFQNKRANWTIRMIEELKVSRTAKFITLTYTDENVPLVEKNNKVYKTLDKDQIRAFLKRLRTKVDRWYETRGDDSLEKALRRPMRYYLVGEYGPRTYRPHYHAIIFNLPKNFDKWLLDAWYVEKKNVGFVHVGKVTQASIYYTTKYLLDGLLSTGSFSDLKDSEGEWIVQKPFNLMSNGIGKDYVKKMEIYHRRTQHNYYTLPGNYKKSLPRYYKEKIFNEYEKQKFAEEAEAEGFKKQDKDRELGRELYSEYEAKKRNVIKRSKQTKI